MRKLLKLKEWLTVSDAAKHLSILFGEEVVKSDVLRLTLDGHLTLSIHFVNGANARCGQIIRDDHLVNDSILNSSLHPGLVYLGDGKALKLDEKIVSLDGVWDLAMLGTERDEVERTFQKLTDGPPVEVDMAKGVVVSREEGFACLLYEPNLFDVTSYVRAQVIPRDSRLVVRTAALQEFEARILDTDKPTEKPLERRERTTLLVIIAALANMAEIDVTKPSKAAASIENQAQLMGAQVAARTIENHLKRSREALGDWAEHLAED